MPAVGLERVSKVVGYTLKKGNFAESSPNLPQRVVILAEANTANQSALADNDYETREITSAKQAGELYGYGSPAYQIVRILRPVGGSGIGGIPTFVIPQAEPGGATAKAVSITPSGTATENGTHKIYISGRDGIDGTFYDINITEGDTTDDITQKIEDAVNNVLGSPVSATSTDYEATLTTKWKGLTANELQVRVDTGDDALGLTYDVATEQAGSGTPSISDALDQFGNAWNTIVINSYGTNTSICNALEAFNGIPDPENPTGRYTGTVFKPFIAVTGSVEEDPSSFTDAREDEVTIAIAPAPLSEGFHFEAAANLGLLFARKAQDTPHLDVSGQSYPDMPTPTDIGLMSDYDERDRIVKKGCSTVDLVAGKYQVQDFVTTYHPEGEIPPQFRYCRNLMLDYNARYTYFLLEQTHVVDHVIAGDSDTVSAENVIKPKQWKGIVFGMFDDLEKRALITDSDFSRDSLEVDISTTNPDRLETFFRYKRTGVARISSTTAEAGFNFGTNQ